MERKWRWENAKALATVYPSGIARKCGVGERIQLPTDGGYFNGCRFGWGSGTRGGGEATGRRLDVI
jgi:hypothetical protein